MIDGGYKIEKQDSEMKILVINSGSSSIKFQLMVMPEQKVIASGMVERIGLDGANIEFVANGDKRTQQLAIPSHENGLALIAKWLMDSDYGVINDAMEIEAVGHRVVHGGSDFSAITLVDDKVKHKIKELFSLAPLHNPHNLKGIEVAENIFKRARQVAVFDTAYHQTIPEEAYRYAIPEELYRAEKIRKYGFHGTSHKYVAHQAIEHLDVKNSKIVTVHLGNGCSVTAVKDGISIEHSLGFGPMNGLVMGTRSGDIDQSVIFYLMEKMGLDHHRVKTILQEESGMLGMTGYSDLREIESKAQQGDRKCLMALKINAFRVKKYIGAYAAIMNGLDAIVFTAGIGENSSMMRELICEEMDYMGVCVDKNKNNVRARSLVEIHKDDSRTKILVIPTNEELEIANQTFKMLNNKN